MTTWGLVKLFFALAVGGIAVLPLVGLWHLVSVAVVQQHAFWYLVQLGADISLPLMAIFMVLVMITDDPWGEPRG